MREIVIQDLPALNNVQGLTERQLLDMYERMVTIRLSEERIAQRVGEGKIRTPCHLYVGQEAVAVGVCTALRDSDYVFSTHRSHGHFLAKGGKLDELIAEIYCRETGCSGGRGGSMHLCDPSVGLLGSSSIVAGCLGIGLGPAFRSVILGEDSVSVIFHGDCVPEEGIWHESLNFAAVKRLPVVYVCENNLYAASASLHDRRLSDNINEVARAHGLHTQLVDGNDVLAVNRAASAAVLRARAGEGPQFIEARTYRWLGHVGPKDDIDVGLRDANELSWWKRRCPIANLEKKLVRENILSEADVQSLYERIQMRIDDAENRAVDAPKPAPESMLENIYSLEV